MGSGKKIVFVFHNSGLTGASLVLLRYVRHLFSAQLYELHFLLPGKGKLEALLREVGTVELYSAPVAKDSIIERSFRKIGVELKRKQTNTDRILSYIETVCPRLIYFNTIACAAHVEVVKQKTMIPVFWHIHELELGVKLTEVNPEGIINRVEQVIANSKTTADFLKANYGVDASKLSVHHPILPEVNNKKKKNTTGFVVGSSGTALVHKGALLFIDLAEEINRLDPQNDFEFRWVGNSRLLQADIDQRIASSSMQGKVKFTGEMESPFDAYAEFDFFVSLSYEESFGLACMEAAAMGIPVGGFSGSGGIEELLKQCDGLLVPHLDVVAMAKALIELRNKPEVLAQMGLKAAQLSTSFLPENVIPAWIKLLESAMNTNTETR